MADRIRWVGRLGQCTIAFDHEPHICSYTMTSSGPKNITFCCGKNPLSKIHRCTPRELEFDPSEEREGYVD